MKTISMPKPFHRYFPTLGALAISFSTLNGAGELIATTPVISISTMDGLNVDGHPDLPKSYKYLREPNAVVTKNGTLLVAFGPHHVKARNDRAHQDILFLRSEDAGQTWSKTSLLTDAGMDSVLPTTFVYDEEKNRALFLYDVIYNAPERKGQEAPAPRQFVIHSDDEGRTWSEEREILPDIKGICVFGGGNGFQIRQGIHKGRLIIPGGVGRATWFFSDDHGQNWRTGSFPNKGRKEATGCETNDGTLVFYHRSSGFGPLESRSTDGGETWSDQRKVLPELWSSNNNSALSIRHKNEDLVIVAGPMGPEAANRKELTEEARNLIRGKEDSKQTARTNGGIFVSRDGGKTFPIQRLVTPGWIFGYNVLVRLPDGRIGLIFEGAKINDDSKKGKRDHNTGVTLGIHMAIIDLEQILKQAL